MASIWFVICKKQILDVHFFMVFFFCFWKSNSKVYSHYEYSEQRHGNSSFSAYYVFGDSTVDSGNNNYIKTTARADFPPYGRDLPDHIPTGRFSNGKLSTDLIYESLGLGESVPAYLDPKLTLYDMLSGVSFASAESGLDNLTAQLSGTLSLWKQVEYFREYKVKLKSVVGSSRASHIIRDALYELSMGSNDILVNYFLLPIRRRHYTLAQYQDLLVDATVGFLEEIRREGGRQMFVTGLGPLGSVPLTKSLFHFRGEGYLNLISQTCLGFNTKLGNAIRSFNERNAKHGARVLYVDAYTVLSDVLNNPSKFGFEVADRGCCGSGTVEVGMTCTDAVPACPDASKYVFWDAIHPTQSYYSIVSQFILGLLNSAV